MAGTLLGGCATVTLPTRRLTSWFLGPVRGRFRSDDGRAGPGADPGAFPLPSLSSMTTTGTAGRTPRIRRTPAPAVRAAAVLAVAALTLSACGDADPATDPIIPAVETSPTTSTAEPTAEPEPSATPTEPATDEGADTGTPAFGTGLKADPSEDAQLSVTDLRTGVHDGFDRAVIDLEGTGTPGWHTQVGATAVEDPIGTEIDLDGAAVLTLTLTGTAYPFETGATELAADTVLPGAGTITGAAFTGTFEGQSQAFVGLARADAAFRVFLLTDPVRVVIDVQQPG